MSKRKAEDAKAVAPATDSDAEEDAALANLAIEDADSDEGGEGEIVEGGWSDDEPVDEDRAEETDEGEDEDEGDEDDEDEEEDDEGSPADDEEESDGLEGSLEDGSEDDEAASDEQEPINRPAATSSRRKVLTKKASPANAATWDSDEDEDSGYSSKDKDKETSKEPADGDLPWWRTNPEIDAHYSSDTSDEETNNTVGNIPLEWYADYPHIGYSIDGKKIMRPATGDALDAFLDKMDDPKSARTFDNPYEGGQVVLTREEMEIIKRIQGQEFAGGADPYEETIEWYTSKVMETPVQAIPEPKSRFIPSKWEGKRIMKIVRAIRKGWIVPGAPKVPPKPPVYMLWNDTDEVPADHVMNIPAPKVAPPEHAESYNPPAEYLPTDQERKEWESMDPEDRPRNFLPQKYGSLRKVPAYTRLMNERFERCLDLYLCPRVRKQKIQMDPEALLPKLPDARDLQPFPMQEAVKYAHGSRVRSISCDASGRWLVSGGDGGVVKLWEVSTGRCWKTWDVEGVVHCVAWSPGRGVEVFAVAVDNSVLLITPGLENEEIKAATESLFRVDAAAADDKTGVVWGKPSSQEEQTGVRAVLKFPRKVTNVVWHRKGDYFATLTPDAPNSPIAVHQLSKRHSQNPFRKSKGTVQKMLFHPGKPFLFVATQRYVRVYDLVKQELHKTLQPGVKWISSIDVHPGGDNLIVGSFDKRICWFDMDLSTKPYRVLRSHAAAVRGVAYHKRYPLFASASDDGTVQVFHGMVYNDLMQNPLIVPLKVLHGHQISDGLGVLGVEFHPVQPWVFSCGADGTVRLFS